MHARNPPNYAVIYTVWGYKDASEPSADDEVHEHVDEEHRTSHNEAPVGEVHDVSSVVFKLIFVQFGIIIVLSVFKPGGSIRVERRVHLYRDNLRITEVVQSESNHEQHPSQDRQRHKRYWNLHEVNQVIVKVARVKLFAIACWYGLTFLAMPTSSCILIAGSSRFWPQSSLCLSCSNERKRA